MLEKDTVEDRKLSGFTNTICTNGCLCCTKVKYSMYTKGLNEPQKVLKGFYALQV